MVKKEFRFGLLFSNSLKKQTLFPFVFSKLRKKTLLIQKTKFFQNFISIV